MARSIVQVGRGRGGRGRQGKGSRGEGVMDRQGCHPGPHVTGPLRPLMRPIDMVVSIVYLLNERQHSLLRQKRTPCLRFVVERVQGRAGLALQHLAH